MKSIVCLANSRKLSGRCVAGVEWDGTARGEWVRPVSGREFGELTPYEIRYKDRTEPRLLDIVDIPVLKHVPHEPQIENWLLTSGRYWLKTGTIDANKLADFVSPPKSLWQNGINTRRGLNDQVPVGSANSRDGTLRLISIERLGLTVLTTVGDTGKIKRRVQGTFTWAKQSYRLWVTDPFVEQQYFEKPDRSYRIGPCYLTISLGEPFQGHHQKLIAAVIEV